MSSKKKIGRVAISKNTDISLIDLAHIACYKSQDIDRGIRGAPCLRSDLTALRGVDKKTLSPSSEAILKRSDPQAKRSSSEAVLKRSGLYFANDDTTSILLF